MKYPLKKYSIWVGYYHLGQGHDGSTNPELVAVDIEATDFKVACLIYELESKLKFIKDTITSDKYLDEQSCRNFYNFDSNSNSWTGKYYETKEEALLSFK